MKKKAGKISFEKKLSAKDLRNLKREMVENPHSTSKSLFDAVSAPEIGKSVRCTVLKSIGIVQWDVLIGPYKVPAGVKINTSHTVSYLMSSCYHG